MDRMRSAFRAVGADQDEPAARRDRWRRRRSSSHEHRAWLNRTLRPGGRRTDAGAAGTAEREADLHGLAAVRARQLAAGGRASCRSDRCGGCRRMDASTAGDSRRRRRAREGVRRELKRNRRRHLGRIVPGDAALGLGRPGRVAKLTRADGGGHCTRQATHRGRREHRSSCLQWAVADARARRGGRGWSRQFVTAAETELVVVLVFFAAAVAGDQMDPRRA